MFDAEFGWSQIRLVPHEVCCSPPRPITGTEPPPRTICFLFPAQPVNLSKDRIFFLTYSTETSTCQSLLEHQSRPLSSQSCYAPHFVRVKATTSREQIPVMRLPELMLSPSSLLQKRACNVLCISVPTCLWCGVHQMIMHCLGATRQHACCAFGAARLHRLQCHPRLNERALPGRSAVIS
jgi:hypothetical protein